LLDAHRRERAPIRQRPRFTGEFLSAAKECFLLIDKDNSGTLDKAEIIKAVKTDPKVTKFITNCPRRRPVVAGWVPPRRASREAHPCAQRHLERSSAGAVRRRRPGRAKPRTRAP